MANKKAPELRFKGFTDDWEQCKLGEVAEIVRGASPRPIQNSKWFDKNSDVGWLRISDVTEQNGRIHHLEQRLSKAGQEKTRVLNEPHLLLSIAATVGKPVINYVKTGVHDGFLIFLRPNFEQEFMFQWLEMFRPKWQKYGQPGSQVNLNSALVRGHEISLPKNDEQTEIGVFFQTLDKTITLHQKKLKKIEKIKYYYLNKLFPNDKDKRPKVRNPNFKSNWDLCTVADLAEYTCGGGTPKTSIEEYWTGKIPWIQSSDLKLNELDRVNVTKYITESAIENSAAKVIPQQSIAIVTRVGVGKLAFIQHAYATSQDFLSLVDLNVDPWFSVYLLYNLVRREINNVQGTSIKGITKTELLNKKILIPRDKAEQEKIGSLLKKLDEMINLHQKKLSSLSTLKKACLQKMFI